MREIHRLDDVRVKTRSPGSLLVGGLAVSSHGNEDERPAHVARDELLWSS